MDWNALGGAPELDLSTAPAGWPSRVDECLASEPGSPAAPGKRRAVAANWRPVVARLKGIWSVVARSIDPCSRSRRIESQASFTLLRCVKHKFHYADFPETNLNRGRGTFQVYIFKCSNISIFFTLKILLQKIFFISKGGPGVRAL